MNHPGRILVLRLAPAAALADLVRSLRQEWPAAQFCVLSASPEGEEEVAAASDQVLLTAGLGPREILRRVRAFAPDLAIIAGGADYGLGPVYLKAALLARLSGARRRLQYEPEESAGFTFGQHAWRTLRHRGQRLRGGMMSYLARHWRRRYYYRKPTRGPRLVQIGLSEACNYQCRMCPFHNPVVDGAHIESELPKLSYEDFSRLVADLKRLGTKDLEVCGNGEPLTNPRAMEMLALACRLGFSVTLATNAGMLTEARARQLVDLGLYRMHVSINAGSDGVYQYLHPGTAPGTMGRIIAQLRRMAEYADETGQRRVDVEYSAVLTRANMDEITDMVEAAQEARAGWLMLIRMGPVSGGDDLLPRPEDWGAIQDQIARARLLAQQLGIQSNLHLWENLAGTAGTRSIYEEIPCYVGSEFALLFASGKVHFCCHCYPSAGDLSTDSFSDIWTSDRYQDLRRRAMALPRTKTALPDCGCFHACSHTALNLEIHERLHGRRRRRP